MLRRAGTGRAGLRLARAAIALGVAVGPVLAASPARAGQVRNAEMAVLSQIGVPAAWQVSQGRGVIVAVLDSGVHPQVSDLAGSVITGPDLTGVATPSSSPDWGQHGTWMASLIAGHGDGNGSNGIIGVAPEARVLSVRVITDPVDPNYSRFQHQSQARGQRELATAIRYAVAHSAGVISMSLGYPVPSLTVRAAIQDALDHNVVVVAAAGNSGTSATVRGGAQAPYSFPADYPGVLSVAALGPSGSTASFSSDNLSVQVAAPGVDVPAQGPSGRYWVVSGTSPACALVAGVAALIRSRYPGLDAAQVRLAITSTASHRPRGGYDDRVGFGTVDAVAALTKAGRLARARLAASGRHGTTPGVSPSAHFGGGSAAIGPVPVGPRSEAAMAWLSAAAAAFLAVLVLALWRLVPEVPGARPGVPPAPGADDAGEGW